MHKGRNKTTPSQKRGGEKRPNATRPNSKEKKRTNPKIQKKPAMLPTGGEIEI